MPDGLPGQVSLNSKHCRAICNEIGERLRHILKPDASELPPRLTRLMTRLEEQDRAAPPIVPSIEEMQWRTTAGIAKSAV